MIPLLMQVYGSSNFGKDMRQLVQKLNTLRGNKEEAELHEVEQENAGWEEDSPLTGDKAMQACSHGRWSCIH